MYDTQQHEMQLEIRQPSGAEEWYCPTCGRRILLEVSPTYGMTIIEPGDTYARHSGSHGGLRIGPVQVAQQDAERDEVSEESLRPWIRALEDLNLRE